MKLNASDPDIQTLAGRIHDGDIDLQPDFQRGSVWNQRKKQLLIDTILRDWHIPPVHIVSHGDDRADEVLDGQQRLAAISEFYEGQFPVDGHLEPKDDEILAVHGKRFSELPPKLSKRVKQFSVRVITITDFSPEEPGELFFRLNHQVTLTPAEARNAYFGEVRDQVKSIARQFNDWGLTAESVGFSNARMAHDDVVARVMTVLDWGSLSEKLTANKLADRYRSGAPFPNKVVNTASIAFQTLGAAISSADSSIRLNKATLWSWILFIAAYHQLGGKAPDENAIGRYMSWFEELRVSLKGFDTETQRGRQTYVAIFNDRASSRVSDVSSVVIRDLVLWGLVEQDPSVANALYKNSTLKRRIDAATKHLSWLSEQLLEENIKTVNVEATLVDRALRNGWGHIQ